MTVVTVTRGELEDIIRNFALKDPKYRQMLRENPKDLLAKQMQTALPDQLKVVAVEETADTVYLVIPYVPEEGATSKKINPFA